MPSVNYNRKNLISKTETREYEHPETGETGTNDVEISKYPFEVRVAKWLEQNANYHLHGHVEVNQFGQTLASKSDPFGWLKDNYTVADELTETMCNEIVSGVSAISNANFDAILNFGNVSPIKSAVTNEESYKFNFEIVLDGPETFDVDWMVVDFDPSRGGA